jgi:hypothetical protein
MPKIGIALSGGGFRGTVWSAGAVLAIADSGLGPDIVSVASVSGASITNGVLAKDLDLTTASSTSVEECLGRLCRYVTGEGLFLFGPSTDSWFRRLLLAGLALIGSGFGLFAAGVVAGRDVIAWWFLLLGLCGLVMVAMLGPKLAAMGVPVSIRRQMVAFSGLVGVPAAALAALTTSSNGWVILVGLAAAGAAVIAATWYLFRVWGEAGRVIGDGLEKSLFGRTPLSAVDRVVHHVFSATELQGGDTLFLTPRLVSSYRLGFGTPGRLTLARAIACSTSLPGAFPPAQLDNSANASFHFRRSYDTNRTGFPAQIDRLVVGDGGICDTFGDVWEQGYHARAARTGSPLALDQGADLLVAVNASKTQEWTPWRAGRVGGGPAAMSRVVDLYYNSAVFQRRERMAASQGVFQGLLINVQTSPLAVIFRFSQHGDEGQKERAMEALPIVQSLANVDEWGRIADANASARTTFGRLSVDEVARILWHAYVLTQVSLRVIFGLGAAPEANLLRFDRFRELCQPLS